MTMKRFFLAFLLVALCFPVFGVDPLVITPDGHILINANGVSIDLAEYLAPVGSILPFAGSTAPQGWALCDGASVPREGIYSRLFAVIGTAFGSSDAATFNLPDLRGQFLRGVDGSAGKDPDKATRVPLHSGGNAGNNVGSYQAGAIPYHGHSLTFNAIMPSANGSSPNLFGGNNSLWGGLNPNYASTIRGDGAHSAPNVSSEARPSNVYVNFIIKV